MADVLIGAAPYDSYADVAFADDYLAADMQRAAPWALLDDDPDKGRALVTATRWLQRLPGWTDGVPDVEAPPVAVQEATALLAADLAGNPALAGSADNGSNVKRVYAEGTGVDFFKAEALATPLPTQAWQLLVSAGLIGGSAAAMPYYSGNGLSRFLRDNDCCPNTGAPEVDSYCG